MAGASSFNLIQHGEDGQVRLERWRRNVGSNVALDLAAPPARPVRSLLVLSWNVWIGRGRLLDVVSQLRDGRFRQYGADPDLPLVILAQEAFRADQSIPPEPVGNAGRVLVAQLRPQSDVVDTARQLGFSLRYAPSMRNGESRSDRGNAILSSLPLEDAHALELPLVLQRRVAVSAAIRLSELSLRVVSAHLDPRGPPGHQWLGLAGRELQARHLVTSIPDDVVVLGADLNLGRGRYERAWRLLAESGFTCGVPDSAPPWRHTFHALPRLVLDYLLIRDRRGVVARASVHRVDEHPQDRGPRVFGSDHHPLLTRIDLDRVQ